MLPEGTIVKAGDELALESGWTEYHYKLVTVDHVTPTGLIVLRDGSVFNKRGIERSTEVHRRKLCLVTDDIREKAQRQRDMAIIQRVNWQKLPTKTLHEVAELLQQKQQA